MSHANYYLAFLLLCEREEVRILQHSAHISPDALAVFVRIAVMHDMNKALTVSQAMALPGLASSAAIHKRIDDLRESGMVNVWFKAPDRRTKYLIPSEKGNRYLKLMGQLLRRSHKIKI